MPDFPLRLDPAGALRGRVDHDGDVVTLALAGDFDLTATDGVTSLLAELEASCPPAIVVDLGEITFMDSSGIRILVAAHGRAQGGHRFAVRDGSGPARRTLQLVGVDKHLEIIP